jgi:hypothetical protein
MKAQSPVFQDQEHWTLAVFKHSAIMNRFVLIKKKRFFILKNSCGRLFYNNFEKNLKINYQIMIFSKYRYKVFSKEAVKDELKRFCTWIVCFITLYLL